MEAIEFVSNYQNYVTEIEQVVRPEYHSVIGKLKGMDPHDIISPESWFMTKSHARGYVWSLFLKEKMR